MCYVLEEVGDQMPHRFFRLNIFLTAFMAIPTDNLSAAIQTIFFFSLGQV
jgi:hypothetical protein